MNIYKATILISLIYPSLVFSETANTVPEKYNIVPSAEVLEAVKAAMGKLSPEDTAQAENAVKEYDRATQQQKEVTAITDTYVVKLHSNKREEIKIIKDYEGELSFFDSNGQPWEVGEVSVGNENILSATKGAILKHSIVISTVNDRYAGRTNLKVRFVGIDVSISFPVHINTTHYHDSLKVVLPGSSPTSKVISSGLYKPRSVLDDPVARKILDNPVNPENNQNCRLRNTLVKSITGDEILGIAPVVFACDNGLYIRSQFLSSPSPNPNGVILGADGYRVYKYLDPIDIFTFRSKQGRSLFVEVIKPQSFIGARFGEQVKLK
jgi:hypothetical protein